MVSKIAVKGKRVAVTTAATTYEADAVLVTLPLGVLKTGKVAFDPPLSAAKQTAIGRLGVGASGSFRSAALHPERGQNQTLQPEFRQTPGGGGERPYSESRYGV